MRVGPGDLSLAWFPLGHGERDLRGVKELGGLVVLEDAERDAVSNAVNECLNVGLGLGERQGETVGVGPGIVPIVPVRPPWYRRPGKPVCTHSYSD